MNRPAVNLGAAGFVSYFEDGGATVDLGEGNSPPQEFEERGVGAFFAEQFLPFVEAKEGALFSASDQPQIRSSASPESAARETYYPEGPTFFEQISEKYKYPLVKNAISGPNRHKRPWRRDDMPTPQELSDARAHALGTALVAADYGPETAETVGAIGEHLPVIGSEKRHRAQDKRNNAVGALIFKQAGIDATPAELASRVDAQIFKQLDAIMARPDSERKFKSGEEGMDLYFPRNQHGYFVADD